MPDTIKREDAPKTEDCFRIGEAVMYRNDKKNVYRVTGFGQDTLELAIIPAQEQLDLIKINAFLGHIWPPATVKIIG
jgi:hypothetical protein